jgi:hypothetical protein
MSDMAVHLRITGLSVSNEDVDFRLAAAKALKGSWQKTTDVQRILAKAADVAHALGGSGVPSQPLGTEVQGAVQKAGASAFIYEDRPLEVGIVAGEAARQIVSMIPGDTGWYVADVWAIGLWLALSYQPPLSDPKRETLRTTLLEAARTRSVAGSEAARIRTTVENFGSVSAPADDPNAFQVSFQKATTATIDALRRNAALDREELDFLWWSQATESRLLKQQYGALNDATRAVTRALEAANQLRRLPADVHRDVALNSIANDQNFTLPGLLTELRDHRARLAEGYVGSMAIAIPAVFPLINALVTEKIDMNGSELERRTSEWGARALLEAAIIKVAAQGPGAL